MAIFGLRIFMKVGEALWQRHKAEEAREEAIKHMQEGVRALFKSIKLDARVTVNRFGAVKREMHSAMQAALDSAADTAVRSAKRRAPVLTGELRSSIDRTPVERSGGGYKVVIYANADHARYVEYGGVRTSAKPFVRPAARAGGKKFRSNVRAEIKSRLPGS